MSEVVNLKQNVIDENDSFNENGTMIEHKDIIESNSDANCFFVNSEGEKAKILSSDFYK